MCFAGLLKSVPPLLFGATLGGAGLAPGDELLAGRAVDEDVVVSADDLRGRSSAWG
jgi:hypothetical protein